MIEKSIGELATFITSGSRGWAKYYAATGKLFLRIQNVKDGRLHLSDVVRVDPPNNQEARRTAVEAGDLLISVTADLGRTAVVPRGLEPAHINQHLVIVRLNGVHPEFVAKYFASPDGQRQFAKLNREGVKAGLNFNDIRSLRIPLPPLSEQKRIAGILDAADALRAKRRQSLAQLDTLLQATFLDMFGDPDSWPHVKVESLALKDRGTFSNGPFGSNLLTTELTETGVPVVYIRDIRGAEYSRVSRVCVTSDKALQLETCQTKPGDILIAKVGDPPGVAAVYPPGEPVGVISQDVIRLRPELSRVLPEYFASYLNSEHGKRKIREITVEATRARFGLLDFKKQLVPLPPIELQHRFAAIVEIVEKQKSRLRSHLAELDALFASLQARAFNGEL